MVHSAHRWVGIAFFLVSLLALLSPVHAVKRHDFKTCAQSGFCRRHRALADRSVEAGPSAWSSPYSVHSPAFEQGSYTAQLANALYPNITFSLRVDFVETSVARDISARIRIDEVGGLRKRYDEAASWTLLRDPTIATGDKRFTVSLGKDKSTIAWGSEGKTKNQELVIEHSPLRLTFSRDKQPHVVLNERGLFNMEHFREKTPVAEAAAEAAPDELVQDPDSSHDKGIVDAPLADGGHFVKFLDTNEDGMWQETFGGRTDSKPKGPESVGLDITFPGYEHVFGIPEHSGPLSLKTTRGGDGAFEDPYRLWNLDVFEYEHDSPMALYGAIPYMQAHRAGSSVAVFWLNAAETWIDIERKPAGRALRGKGESTTTHWFSESGVLDLFVFLGPTPTDLFASYSSLTGTTALPQYFAIGHHQCRWNYLSQDDVLEVSQRFDEADIPMDVIWLDIEYAQDHKYFVWDRRTFSEPEKMQEGLAERGRQLVAIIDPHIKRTSDLYVYKEAQDLDILSKTPDGKEYEGWCWTGSSSWTDFFHPKSWDWWIGLFKFDKFAGSTRNLFVWNDMNEPSVFNGPEITMPKDNLHHGGWEHRDVHNINGMLYHNLTAQALIEREAEPRRPFVLSRAFFAGSQRFGAIWTGDNLGSWEHLAVSIPMVLANGVGGMAWSGADVGGFFGNPAIDFLVRWYQAGCLAPFFRAHAHIDTKRREPYLFDEPHRGHIRDSIRLRYTLLPTLYTAFYESSVSGIPIARPQFVVLPEDTKGFAVDTQFWLGSSGLLVRPVVEKDATQADVYLAGDQPYYGYFDHSILPPAGHLTYPAALDILPLFLQGGHILSRRDIVRRAAPLHHRDPVTLVIALDATGKEASGLLYLDDGDSYAYEKGDQLLRQFRFGPSASNAGVLALANGNALATAPQLSKAAHYQVNVEAIEILGLAERPTCIRRGAEALAFNWQPGVAATATKKRGGIGKRASVLRIERASAPVASDWSITFSFDATAACDGSAKAALPFGADLQSPECPVGRFRCQNVGHVPSCILTSRVNDGICDDDCCDGSDEFDGHCSNRCKAIGAAARAVAEEEARKGRVGAKLRAEYAAFGAKERIKLGTLVNYLELELVSFEAEEKRLRAVLEQTEARAADDTERKKATPLYKRLVEYQEAIRSLRKQRTNLESHVGDLTSMMTELKSGYNPNNQDMAVKHAVLGFEEWQREHGQLEAAPAEGEGETAPAPAPAPMASETVDEPDDISDEALEAMESEDPLTLMDALAENRVGSPQEDGPSLLFRLEEYIPRAWRPAYDASIDFVLELFTQLGITQSTSRRRGGSQAADGNERPDIARARSAHQAAETALREGKDKLEKEKGVLDRDWGKDWEWKKLDGLCVEKDTGEYTYEVCLFGAGKQKTNGGHMQTTLGHFSSWNPDAQPGTDAYYQRQVYSGGQKCWNGPERSIKLDIVCGTSNALLSIIEPEKCEYLMKMTSPAVCKADGKTGKTEL